MVDVKATFEKYGRCVIAVSEGIQDENGTPIITKLMKDVETDAHGNVQLSGTGALGDLLAQEIREKVKIKRVRADTFGYLQRCFVGCVSDVDAREAREVGEKAAQFAICDNQSGSITTKRVGDYAVDYILEKLENIAAKTKHMNPEFINEEGNFVTNEFIQYVRPLVGTNLPQATRIRAPKVEKILNK